MKTLQAKLNQSQNKLGIIYQYNQHIMNIGDPQQIQELQQSMADSKTHKKKQSYADKQQNVSILQIQKPIIEFDIQISRDYSDKMVIFLESVPEEIVEEFIVYNRMRPQSFSPILISVLEKMKQVENEKDICFSNLRDDKYYQILMKKQQQLCQDLQNVKDMILREKTRGDQLINLKLSRSQIQNQPEKKDVASQSPPQKEIEEYKQELSSIKGSTRDMTQRSPYREVSQFPQNAYQYNRDLSNSTPSQHHSNQNRELDSANSQLYQDKDLVQENQPLQLYYDHLNNTNQDNNIHNIYLPHNAQKPRSATPKTHKTLDNSKKMQRSTPSPSPPPTHPKQNKPNVISKLKFVKNGHPPRDRSNSPMNPTSPLKYPNEESYRDKNERKKNYYNHAGELVDPYEVSERLHKQKKEPPCSKYEPKIDLSSKECTFKPSINENSRNLSKLYHQKQNAKGPKNQSAKDNEQDLSQRLRSKSKGKTNHKNQDGNGEVESQGGDTTIYQVVNSSQLKSSTNSQARMIKEDFPSEEQTYINQPPIQQEFPSNHSNRQLNTSPLDEYNQYPQSAYNYIPQKPSAPVYEKQINIREEIVYQHPEKIYQPQRVSKLKQMQEHSVQTSEFINQSSDVPENTAPVPFDPNLNKNYFKYLQMRDDMENEDENQDNPPLLQSFSKQPSVPQQPLKKSFGMQTSEQIQSSRFNKSSSLKTSDMQSERKAIDFDPNLNKNYFKFLQMQEDIENEKGQLPQFAPQQSTVIQSKALPHFSHQAPPPQPIIEKKTVSLQTSEYLMYLKSQQQKTEDGSDKENNFGDYSQEETPKPYVPFDPNLNKNYFKFLQMEDDKQKEEEQLRQQIKSNVQSKTSQSIDDKSSSQQSYHHINRKKYEEETPREQSQQAAPFDPHLNQNYFKYLAMQDDKDLNESLNSYKLDQQDEQNPQQKQFPDGRNSPFKRSPKSYQQQPSPPSHKPNSSSIVSNTSNQDQNKNYKLNGSIYYCDEDPVALSSDDPFMTNSQKHLQMQHHPNNRDSPSKDSRQNLHYSNFNKPKESQMVQKPDIAISSVRSVSPRIDKSASNIHQSVSPRNVNQPSQNQQMGKGINNNMPQFHTNGLQLSQSHSNLFQSKVRGQISEAEQEALEEVYRTMKAAQKGSYLRKIDIDFYNLPFEVVLRSHIEIILKNFTDTEDITLQGFFQASERSNNLNLFLNECVDFLKKKKQF